LTADARATADEAAGGREPTIAKKSSVLQVAFQVLFQIAPS
jgi:hypothetical protein